jgi:hypothetical protein
MANLPTLYTLLKRVWILIIATVLIFLWTVYINYTDFNWEREFLHLWLALFIAWCIRVMELFAQMYRFKPRLATCNAPIERKVIPRWPLWAVYIALVLLTITTKFTTFLPAFDTIILFCILGLASMLRTYQMCVACFKCWIYEFTNADYHRQSADRSTRKRLTV